MMVNKFRFLGLGMGLAIAFVPGVEAAPWRSNQGTIQDLENVCWGDRQLENMQLRFGRRSYRGKIQLDRIYRTNGCQPGDRLQGRFILAGTFGAACQGTVMIKFANETQAELTWEFLNLKNQPDCPVEYDYWETQLQAATASESQSYTYTVAKVGSDPARVRTAPNGALICTLAPTSDVRITSQPYNGWYRTDACGSLGYVHDDYLVFFNR